MSNSRYGIDFNFLKLGFWLTVLMILLKITNTVDINTWLVFLPLLIAIGWFVLIIFLIGLITLYYISKNTDDEEDTETEETQDP